MSVVFERAPWGAQVHECDEFKKESAIARVYPALITEIYFDQSEKRPAVTNQADISYVRFCPYCGANLNNNE